MLTVALTLNLVHNFRCQPLSEAFLPSSVGTDTGDARSIPAIRPNDSSLLMIYFMRAKLLCLSHRALYNNSFRTVPTQFTVLSVKSKSTSPSPASTSHSSKSERSTKSMSYDQSPVRRWRISGLPAHFYRPKSG